MLLLLHETFMTLLAPCYRWRQATTLPSQAILMLTITGVSRLYVHPIHLLVVYCRQALSSTWQPTHAGMHSPLGAH